MLFLPASDEMRKSNKSKRKEVIALISHGVQTTPAQYYSAMSQNTAKTEQVFTMTVVNLMLFFFCQKDGWIALQCRK